MHETLLVNDPMLGENKMAALGYTVKKGFIGSIIYKAGTGYNFLCVQQFLKFWTKLVE